MKKTMNKFSALLAVVFIAFAFTGCGYTPLKLYFLEKKTY